MAIKQFMAIKMYSVYNEGNSVVGGRFARTLIRI